MTQSIERAGEESYASMIGLVSEIARALGRLP